MEARFFCETGALAGADHRIGGDATIGRGPSNTIVVADGVVSKTHARIAFDAAAAAWFLEDLGSTNGTRLDGAPVSGRIRLRDLHVVTLGGRHDFVFVVPSGDARPAAATPAARPSDAGAPVVGAPGTRYEPASALSVPPLVAGGDPGAAAGDSSSADADSRRPSSPAPSAPSSSSSIGRDGTGDPRPSSESGAPVVGASGTRYEPASALSVPPLVAGGDPGAAAAGDSASAGGGSPGASAPAPSAPSSSSSVGRDGAGDPRPSSESVVGASGTRYEPAPVLSVPPLAAGGDAGAAAAGDSASVGGDSRRPSVPAPSAPSSSSSSVGREGTGDPRPSSESGAPVVGASGTRYEPASALSVPPLAPRGDAAVDAAGDPPRATGDRPALVGGPPAEKAEPARETGASAGVSRSRPTPPPTPTRGTRETERSGGSGPNRPACPVPPESSAASAASPGAIAPGEAAPPAGVSFDVRIAGAEPRRVRLGAGRHVVGRAKGCDVPIDDRTLSRRHAAFVVHGGRVTVADLGSLNGTFVDGTRVDEETEVGAAGVVGLGEAVMVVRVVP